MDRGREGKGREGVGSEVLWQEAGLIEVGDGGVWIDGASKGGNVASEGEDARAQEGGLRDLNAGRRKPACPGYRCCEVTMLLLLLLLLFLLQT